MPSDSNLKCGNLYLRATLGCSCKSMSSAVEQHGDKKDLDDPPSRRLYLFLNLLSNNTSMYVCIYIYIYMYIYT